MRYAPRHGSGRVGVVMVVLVGAVFAGLSPAAAAGPRSVALAGGLARESGEPSVHRGSFWTHAACTQAGREGAAAGRWSRFTCVSSHVSWALWTDR
jgi:hypothetical protein